MPKYPKKTVLHGDCLAKLKTLSSNSVDSMVTDPPAGISFMGKAWDSDKGGREAWIAWMESVMRECLRVLKPGAHALVWALPRTSHWTGTALEQAGFEVRDTILHCFGSGFPKSLAVDKAIDKMNGDRRPVVGHRRAHDIRGGRMHASNGQPQIKLPITSAASAAWSGWGTALKPAVEIWWLVRKPLSEKTVARNVLKHGVGALNVDASRIGFAGAKDKAAAAAAAAAQRLCRDQNKNRTGYGRFENGAASLAPYLDGMDKGRFPANLVLSHHPACEERICVPECAVRELNRQSGVSKSPTKVGQGGNTFGGGSQRGGKVVPCFGDSGGASCFFATFAYVAKPSKRERNLGCEGMPKKAPAFGGAKGDGLGRGISNTRQDIPHANTHPTIKPLKLMRYLITMVTPPGGVCLDPFLGSGTTGCAALQAGFRFIGIEREKEYVKISKARMRAAEKAAIATLKAAAASARDEDEEEVAC